MGEIQWYKRRYGNRNLLDLDTSKYLHRSSVTQCAGVVSFWCGGIFADLVLPVMPHQRLTTRSDRAQKGLSSS